MTTWFWAALVAVGTGQIWWAHVSLPPGTSPLPVPVRTRTTAGPYRFLRHPMYVGNVLVVMGVGGLAAGYWNAAALGLLAILVMGEWAGREEVG